MLSTNDYNARRAAGPQKTPTPVASTPISRVASTSTATGSTYPTSRDIRGPGSTHIVAPHKNVATDKAQLSLPVAIVKEGKKERHPKGASDVTRHAADALATCHGDIFKKEYCSTSKGWSTGQFS